MVQSSISSEYSTFLRLEVQFHNSIESARISDALCRASCKNRSNEPGQVLQTKIEVMNPVMRDLPLFDASGSLLRILQAPYLHFFCERFPGCITEFIASILAGNAATDPHCIRQYARAVTTSTKHTAAGG